MRTRRRRMRTTTTLPRVDGVGMIGDAADGDSEAGSEFAAGEGDGQQQQKHHHHHHHPEVGKAQKRWRNRTKRNSWRSACLLRSKPSQQLL
mmetsp:Transcript_18831/g.40439  ORF Transcript_18831/g.40439 Transcript_18831/m.40439 type:complete len:91 (-) Transcript_18831:100-372(-)